MDIAVTVNGQTYERDVEPRKLLIHFLRDDLDLTGSHIGCDTGNCGACSVIVDGVLLKSCMLLAVQADGTCICNAAASVNGSVRVALGCVDAVPVLVSADSPDGVADAVRAANLVPPSDVHASSEYRRHLATVLATRAAQEASAR